MYSALSEPKAGFHDEAVHAGVCQGLFEVCPTPFTRPCRAPQELKT